MFTKLRQDIYNVFASNNWKNTGVKVYPENYQGDTSDALPFMRLTIIPGKASWDSFSLQKKLSGVMILSIFVDNTSGDKDLYSMAELLNSYFQGKTLTNGTQFGPSTVSAIGIDTANSSIYRGDYSIQFTSYGE